jgi:hypothetical protein
MSRPSGSDVLEFSYHHIWESVVTENVAERINTRAEFVNFLKSKGHVQMIAEEYAEKNIGLLLNRVQAVCEQWDALGIPRPLEVIDQGGSMITWRHPKFEAISGRRKLSENFCDVWRWVRDSRDREFLLCCAAYLHLIGCSRIYITDTSGDGGIDLIGIYENEPLRGVCFLVQAKTALNEVGKESLFSDYTKYLLLRRNARWSEYEKALGIDRTADGVGIVYLFASNQEFNPPIVQAARDLPIMLRSGRQIAHALSNRAPISTWIRVRDHVGETSASLSRNLGGHIMEAL